MQIMSISLEFTMHLISPSLLNSEQALRCGEDHLLLLGVPVSLRVTGSLVVLLAEVLHALDLVTCVLDTFRLSRRIFLASNSNFLSL